MRKKILIILSILTILTISTRNNNIYTKKYIINNKIRDKITNVIELYSKELTNNTNKEKPIGKIIIDKINIDEELYEINSNENNIEKHITILKESTTPDNTNSIMILAAHSGTGKIAYFEQLNKLKIDDTVKLIYKDNNYIYKINNIWEEKKNGYININREQHKQLVLTTCSPNNNYYQLIVNCIEKES